MNRSVHFLGSKVVTFACTQSVVGAPLWLKLRSQSIKGYVRYTFPVLWPLHAWSSWVDAHRPSHAENVTFNCAQFHHNVAGCNSSHQIDSVHRALVDSPV